MRSGIYEGIVRHRRFEPTLHNFRSRLFMMYLDLEELPVVFQRRWFWSVDKPNVASFFRRDHTGEPAISLDETIRDLVESETAHRPSGRIRLLTHLKYFGYCFNPLSVYFCFDAADEQIESIVAEVTNTPWGERHCYVLNAASDTYDPMETREEAFGDATGSDAAMADVSKKPYLHATPMLKHAFTFDKTFHVSPFMSMDFEYCWKLSGPGDRLVLHTENWRDHRVYFDATLTLERREITTWSLARVLLVYPFMTLQVIANIHWQALRLWWKGVSYVPHPKTCRIASLVKNTDEAANTSSIGNLKQHE